MTKSFISLTGTHLTILINLVYHTEKKIIIMSCLENYVRTKIVYRSSPKHLGQIRDCVPFPFSLPKPFF